MTKHPSSQEIEALIWIGWNLNKKRRARKHEFSLSINLYCGIQWYLILKDIIETCSIDF